MVGGVFIAMVTIQVSVTNNYDNPMYHAYSIPRYMYMYYNTMLFPYGYDWILGSGQAKDLD